jgi:Heterokaryon incompatibility protein (HET)
MSERINWEQLPQLFKDAILVSRFLGLQYLWIDALCILQDGVVDWGGEYARMGSIYYHSYVTIGATSCRDSTESLSAIVFKDIQLGRISAISEETSALAGTTGGDLIYPLHYRGWAFQELLLPSPFLDFELGIEHGSLRKHFKFLRRSGLPTSYNLRLQQGSFEGCGKPSNYYLIVVHFQKATEEPPNPQSPAMTWSPCVTVLQTPASFRDIHSNGPGF